MAVRYYGVSISGQAPADVTIAASTTSSDIELAVDDTNLTAAAVDARVVIGQALEAIALAVEQDSY